MCTIRLSSQTLFRVWFEFDFRLFWLPQTNFLCQVNSRLNLDFKQGGDLLPGLARGAICRAALTRSGQQPHPRRRLRKWGDTLLSQVLQLQLVLTGVLLLSVNYLINESESRNKTTVDRCLGIVVLKITFSFCLTLSSNSLVTSVKASWENLQLSPW